MNAPDPRAPSALPTRTIVGVVMFGVVLYAALVLYSDVQALRSKLDGFAWSTFGIALVLATLNYLLRFLRWEVYLRAIAVRVPLRTSVLVFLSGFVMSITPGKLGELFKAVLLRETDGVPVAKTAPVVIAERVTDLAALVLLTSLGALQFPHGIEITAGGFVIVGTLLAVCAFRPLGELAFSIFEKTPVRRIVPKLREAYESLLAISGKRPLALATLLSFGAWGLEAISLSMLVNGFAGEHASVSLGVFAYSASTIVGALAMLPGGLGVTESGMTGLLRTGSANAVSLSVATASTLLVRIATLWWAVFLGILAFLLLRRLMPAETKTHD